MKKILFILTLTISQLVFISCSEDNPTSKLPRFSDITYDITTVSEGKKITAIALQAEKGSLIYKAVYTWEVSGSEGKDSIVQKSEKIYDNDPANPQVTFTVPANETSVNVKLKAVYSPSAGVWSGLPGISTISSGYITYQQNNGVAGIVTISKNINLRIY